MSSLKEKTFQLHEKLEETKVIKKLGSFDFTLEEYTEILKRFFGAIKAIENQIDNTSYPNKREEELIKDLTLLNVSREELNELPLMKVSSEFQIQEEVFAYIYVLEGSRNGGMMISKGLAERFGSEVPCNYFYGFGEKTPMIWGGFMQELMSKDLNQEKLVEAVELCYRDLIDWFDYEL